MCLLFFVSKFIITEIYNLHEVWGEGAVKVLPNPQLTLQHWDWQTIIDQDLVSSLMWYL